MQKPADKSARDDPGQLSMDFLAGITLFMLGLILVVTMVSGILVHLQGKTTDYDAVAYRTGVILVEDPGYWGCEPPNCPANPPEWLFSRYTDPNNPPNSYANGSEWEMLADDPALKPFIKRFGLYNSVEGGIRQPNRDGSWVLSSDKVEKFFRSSSFSEDDVYSKAVFGTGEVGKTVSFFDLYSPSWGQLKYNYNISLSIRQEDGTWKTMTRGKVSPDNTGYIKRVVKIKKSSSAESNDGPTIKINKLDYTGTESVLAMKIPFGQLYNTTFGQNYWLDIRNSQFFVNISNATQFTISGINITIEGNETPPIDYANITLVEDGVPVSISSSGDISSGSGSKFNFSFPKTFFANEIAFRPETTSYMNFAVGGTDGGGTGTFDYQNVTPIRLYDGVLEVRIW